jgi:hypothetical protein
LQASVVHGLPSSTRGGVPATQTAEALHVSAPLQLSLSEQLVPAATGVWLTPEEALHASTVHGLPSSTAGGVPAVQWADALHVSLPLQALPSEQLVPAGTGVCVTTPFVSESAVQGLPSSMLTGVHTFAPPPEGTWQVNPGWHSESPWQRPPPAH